MSKIYLLALTLFTISLNVTSQRYYTDDVFDAVTVETDIEYGSNYSILDFPFSAIPLLMDVYLPEGDTATDKPLVLLLHTGNFLPTLFADGMTGFNGAATGAKNDSSLVFVANQLTKRGFAVASLDYRLGWAPSSASGEVRTKTLLEAYYRSIQDVRTAIRFFRKDVAENGNSYGIDPSKIATLGQGTGGYISFGVAAVDQPEEVSLPEITNPNDGTSYIDFEKLGDIYGTNDLFNDNGDQIGFANHVGYDSDIQFAMNFGGACGTENWIDENTPPMAGAHVIKDPFAPYDCNGAVIVPTTGEFVIEVDGTKCIIEIANDLGINDDLLAAHFNDDYTLASEQFDDVDNLFGISTVEEEAGPWDWWDMDFWSNIIPFSGGDNVNIGMLENNMDASREKALAYTDTIVNFFCPRAMVAMQIEGFEIFNDPDNTVGFTGTSGIANQLDEGLIEISPNPASNQVYIQLNKELSLEQVELFDPTGKQILQRNLDGELSELKFENLNSGLYSLRFTTKEGLITKKLFIQ